MKNYLETYILENRISNINKRYDRPIDRSFQLEVNVTRTTAILRNAFSKNKPFFLFETLQCMHSDEVVLYPISIIAVSFENSNKTLSYYPTYSSPTDRKSNIWQSAAFPYIKEARKAAKL